MRLVLVFVTGCLLSGCGAGVCDGRRMADPTDPCFCTNIPRTEPPPWSTSAPPTYALDEIDEPSRGSLYAPEAVEPSRGNRGHGAPSGPVTIP